jgi:hypothetical protein
MAEHGVFATINWKMPNHFRRELTISAIVIFGGLAIFSAVFYLLSSDLISQTGKIVADKALLAKRTATLEALASLKKDAAGAVLYKQAMDRLLVSQDQLIDFPKWLDSLARVRQIGLNFSFTGDQVPPGIDTPGYIIFSIDINGALDNLIAFIRDIELQSPRFLVALSGFDLNKTDSNYRITSQGRVFFR